MTVSPTQIYIYDKKLLLLLLLLCHISEPVHQKSDQLKITLQKFSQYIKTSFKNEESKAERRLGQNIHE